MQLRARDKEGNVTCEVKGFCVERTLNPSWDETLTLDIDDVHKDSLVELAVYDSHTGHMLGLVGIPVLAIHRNPKKRWIRLQDPECEQVSLMAGVVEADHFDLESCRFGVIEMEHSLSWRSGQTMRQRIMEVMAETLE